MRAVCMGGTILVVALLSLGSRSAAATLTILPPAPTADDSVEVRGATGFANTCWSVAGYACTRVGADTLNLTMDLQYCRGRESCVCADFPTLFVRICNFGPLPAGNYVARLIENHINPSDPISSSTVTQVFTVGQSVPTLRRSWGRVKTVYR